jgi:hypothetical protein
VLRKIDHQWTAGQFIFFRNQGRIAKGKTDLIRVFSTRDGVTETSWPMAAHLGEIKWFSQWRKYCFFPTNWTIFEEDCLRDIAEYLETVTREHRAKRKNERLVSQCP